MKTLFENKLPSAGSWRTAGLPTLALLMWWLVGKFYDSQHIMGAIDPAVVQVIALALLVWLLILALATGIIDKLLSRIVLHVNDFFQTSNSLTPWQYYVLYLALFALLVFSGTACLIAIC